MIEIPLDFTFQVLALGRLIHRKGVFSWFGFAFPTQREN